MSYITIFSKKYLNIGIDIHFHGRKQKGKIKKTTMIVLIEIVP